MGPFRALLDRQFAALLPGDGTYPAYEASRSGAFWAGFLRHAPLLVKVGLSACAVVLLLHGLWSRLLGVRDPVERMERAARSPSYLVGQSVTFVKLLATQAYFADPGTQRIARDGAAR